MDPNFGTKWSAVTEIKTSRYSLVDTVILCLSISSGLIHFITTYLCYSTSKKEPSCNGDKI